MGGFAEDALLGGQITRERADIDLLVDEANWDRVRELLQSILSGGLKARIPGPHNQPLAYVGAMPDFKVEVWLAERTQDNYAIVLPGLDRRDEQPAFYRLTLESDTFLFPGTGLEDVAVQTISPRALVRFRGASAQTRGDEEKRRADLDVMARLSRAYLGDRALADLMPEITKLAQDNYR
jgi:hypothetical protein